MKNTSPSALPEGGAVQHLREGVGDVRPHLEMGNAPPGLTQNGFNGGTR